jgi:DNA-directed RNA polymerase specialized sigma54-like protein
MSDFAFFRFMSQGMLTREEKEHKSEIITLTEEVLHEKGIKCDASIAKVSEDELKEILDKVRVLRKKKRKEISSSEVTTIISADDRRGEEEEEKNEEAEAIASV